MTLQSLYNYECDKLLNGVDLFRALLPHGEHDSSIHSGEEGRFVENLVTTFLRNSLPGGLKVATGFIVCSGNIDIKSGQLDIIVYDDQKYSAIMKYGDAVVVHDKSVIAAISIKKKLSRQEFTSEVESLSKIGAMCGKNQQPKPYLAIFALDIRGLSNFEDTVNDAISRLREAYPERRQGWSENEMINDVIVLNKFILKKRDIKEEKPKELKAKYIMCGGNNEHRNIYVQHLVHGIGKVLNERNHCSHSVLTKFPSIDFRKATEIDLCTHDRPYKS